jgi:glycosyltransferase involved in cell wall biosynthesis
VDGRRRPAYDATAREPGRHLDVTRIKAATAAGAMAPEARADSGQVRVCHMIHSLGPGGAEQALLELARVAPATGIALSVLSLVRTADDRYYRSLRAAGAEVVRLDLPTRWDGRVFGRALAAARRLAPDLVHTHLKHADLAGSYATRRMGIPMVSTLHLIEDGGSLPGRAKQRLAVAARRRSAALTIAVSEALRRWYVHTFAVPPARVMTIHNGIAAPSIPLSAGRRAAIRGELGVLPASTLVAMVGIMRAGKGHAQLIEAARRIPESARVHLLFVGDGPLRRQLTAAAAGLRCPVTFAGFRTDVPALLAASDLVAHPAHADALPTALIEALAVGRAVVATAVGGIPEIVTPEVGRLVRSADVAALAAEITGLAMDRDARRRLGAGARARFERQFEAGQWARRLRRCYDDVLLGRVAGCPPAGP